MVITHGVENVEKWLENKKERHGIISQFSKNIVEYFIDNGSKVVALTFTTTVKQKMANIMQDENTRLEMIRHGVKPATNNNYFER